MEFEELRKMKKELEQTAIIEQEYGNITGKIENSIGTYLQFGKEIKEQRLIQPEIYPKNIEINQVEGIGEIVPDGCLPVYELK